MLGFVLKFLLFLVPIAAVFVFPAYVFWQGREFVTIDAVVEIQKTPQPMLFGLAYRNIDKRYKETLIRSRNSEIIALGTSRVMEFRSSFFSRPESFTNGGGAVTNLDDMKNLIAELEDDSRVKMLLLGLDQKFFRPTQGDSSRSQLPTQNDPLHAFLAGAWRRAYLDYAAGKFTLAGLRYAHTTSPHVGLSALVDRSGFLNDGSYYYGKITKDPLRLATIESSIQDILERTRNDRSSFYYGTTTSQASLDTLRDLLELCKTRGIYVVGILPPYAPALYEEMTTVDDVYSKTMYALPTSVGDVLSEFEFPLFDYSNAHTVGITDTEFIDPGHASDKAYLRILIDVAKRSQQLARHVSIRELQETLAETPGDFVYELE